MAERSRSLIALPDGEFDGAFIGSNRMGHVQRAEQFRWIKVFFEFERTNLVDMFPRPMLPSHGHHYK